MSVSVDRYTTSKFILKDDAAVEHIKRLVELMRDESNLSSGYLRSDSYIELYEYGDRAFKFVGDGFMDSSPELRYYAVKGLDGERTEDEKYDDDENYEPISFFSEVQENLAEEGWFFVENHTAEKSYFSSQISLYCQNGKSDYSGSYEIKKEMLKKLGITGKVE